LETNKNLKIPAVNPERTDNTIAKRKGAKKKFEKIPINLRRYPVAKKTD